MMGLGNPIKWDSIEFPEHEWLTYRDELAGAARKPKDWATVSGVFDQMEYISQEAERYEWPAELTDFDVECLEALYQETDRALKVLHGYAGTAKPPRRVRRIRRRLAFRQRLRSLRKVAT